MPLRIYNTLSKTTEEFRPIVADKVGMYSCGPTVYNNAHIGNFRSVVMYDLMRRSLEYLGYEVKQIMNITDVDDKIIAKAKEDGVSAHDVASKYEKIFLDDMTRLNALVPTVMPRATDYIKDMVDLIEDLLAKGFAYKIDSGPNVEGGIYMSVSKVTDYGKLLGAAGQASLAAEQKSEDNNAAKQDPRDFALWKFYVPEDGDTVFDASFGRGRPGWHIECSAMSMQTLGKTFDIHTGGSDMVFPHHTNEIAQSETANGVALANYWLHFAFVNIAGDKMSKSKKNFYTLDDLVAESVSPIAYRFWLLQAHYRSTVDFSFESVKAAQQGLFKLILQLKEMRRSIESGDAGKGYDENVFESYENLFRIHLENDFDLPGALATVWKAMKDPELSKDGKVEFALRADKVLGLGLAKLIENDEEDAPLPPEIEALAELRTQARADRDWDKADALRKEIEARGFVVKDNPTGQDVSKA